MPVCRSKYSQFVLPWLLVFVFVAFFQPSQATVITAQNQNQMPSVVVSGFDSSLLATMKGGDTAGMRERCAIMLRAVRDSFGLPFIARLVLGHYWKTFTPIQRTRFMHLFSRLVAATYAYNFNGYNGQKIRIDRSIVRGHNAYVYTTFFVPGHGHRHSFDYVLHNTGGRWLIVNIVADGVSDMAIKRAEYQGFMRHGSVAALLHAIQHQYSMLLEMGAHKKR